MAGRVIDQQFRNAPIVSIAPSTDREPGTQGRWRALYGIIAGLKMNYWIGVRFPSPEERERARTNIRYARFNSERGVIVKTRLIGDVVYIKKIPMSRTEVY